MAQKLTDFLEQYIKRKSFFKNRKALQTNYTPKTVPYRSDQINQLAGILAPSLKMDKPSNIFIYGKTGSGKTLVAKHVSENITRIAKENNINLRIIYLNCKLKRVADTEYRLIAQISRDFGQDIPSTGLPTAEVYKMFLHALDQKKTTLIIILDEIDELVHKIGDAILYNMTRLNAELEHSEISFIGISNDLTFIDHVDARVKSSLSEEEIIFPPYNAIQLQKILRQRTKLTFFDNIIGEGVIEKCAAYAAREHGDARRALELLRVAAELAERKNEKIITSNYLDTAEEKIERDRVIENIITQPKQFKITLYSILTSCKGDSGVFTGDVYSVYKDYCLKSGMKPLTQRRLGDIIAELDMLGIINARVISKGRYGRTKEINIALPKDNIQEIQNLIKDSIGF